jgi:hypothetical protein
MVLWCWTFDSFSWSSWPFYPFPLIFFYITTEKPATYRIFVSILTFYKKNWETKPSETYFRILTLLSQASQVSVTYEGVTLVHMIRLIFTWTSGVTSIRLVPPHLSISKMSHVVWVASVFLRVTHFETKSTNSVFLIIYCFL